MTLDPSRTALVLIDLQPRILALSMEPHSPAEIVARSARLAARCRQLDLAVVLVTVAYSPDGRDRLATLVDAPLSAGIALGPDAAQVTPDLQPVPTDIVIVKRQWGAFYGTDLELHLRRRGIDTLLLGGIGTNFGVESTARDAWERGFHVVFLEDAMASVAAEAHSFSVSFVFPRLGRVRSVAEVLQALEAAS